MCSQDEGSCQTAARALEDELEEIRGGGDEAKQVLRERSYVCASSPPSGVLPPVLDLNVEESPAIGAWQCLIEIVDQWGLLIKAVGVSAVG
jgi:hypothetical protein